MLKKFFKATPAPPPVESVKLLEQHYWQQVEQQLIGYDDAQFIAVQQLQTLLENVVSHKASASLYIYGEVGRGKSMLMDLFYAVCPLTQKRRVFFHSFMLEVHAFIHDLQQQNKTDAISVLAKKIRTDSLLLCFDEFHITDIADAMILQRLFSRLFELGVVLVITSNRHPDDLYQGGLQKEQALVFTRLLQKHTCIVELQAKKDYRLSYPPALSPAYHFPLGSQADSFLQQRYNSLTHSAAKQSGVLPLLGRELFLSAVYDNIALLSFSELCAQPLGSADYLKLAQHFNTIIISDIPKLSAEKRNEAKRFVILIDTLYEHKVQLICTAEVPIQALYTEGDGAFEFKRTVSRLMEMQSANYPLKT